MKESMTGMSMVKKVLLRLVQGAFIGVGAVLPGISGGVLCVVFGIYQPIMQLLSHPVKALKEYAGMLIPIIIGIGVGFLGVSKLLGFFLTKYPDPSVCLFVGLILGMLPSLFREAGEKGRTKASFVSLLVSFTLMLLLLLCLQLIEVSIVPNNWWYLFCGFCMALSVIAPGMSFSTLLMPLGLYTPLVEGIGNLDVRIIIPSGLGAVLTVILLAKAVTMLMERHYAVVFHGIIGIVIAATIVIIPFSGFAGGVHACAVNVLCMAVGAVVALLLDAWNQTIEVPKSEELG